MLVLASNSPRRRELLALGGWKFIVVPAEVDERTLPGEAPGDYVSRLAQNKALEAWQVLGCPGADTVILAADTAVVDRVMAGSPGHDILGKPVDAKEAEGMLRRLRGRSHHVYTGIATLRANDLAPASKPEMLSEVVITEVPMRNYRDDEILSYVESGDPMDKAGAYAIQHVEFKPVEHLSGCYANVVGLPLCHVSLLLNQMSKSASADLAQSCQRSLGYDCDIFQQVLSGSILSGQK